MNLDVCCHSESTRKQARRSRQHKSLRSLQTHVVCWKTQPKMTFCVRDLEFIAPVINKVCRLHALLNNGGDLVGWEQLTFVHFRGIISVPDDFSPDIPTSFQLYGITWFYIVGGSPNECWVKCRRAQLWNFKGELYQIVLECGASSRTLTLNIMPY